MAKDRPDIIVIPPLALVAAIGASALLEWLMPLGLLPAFVWTGGLVLGLPLMAAALVINVLGARSFLRAKTPINPYKTPTAVVRTGIYGVTRNPMYLGMVVFLPSLALVFSLDWALLATPLLWAVFHWGVVLPEERFLAAKFGATYTDFLKTTRRWL